MNTRRTLVTLVAAICLATLGTAARGQLGAADVFLRGDTNTDGQVSISDAITIKLYLFKGGTPPSCMDTADLNDDGFVNVTDEVLVLLEFIPGRGGWSETIASPFPDAGADPTEDDLGCESYEPQPPEQTDDLVRLGDITAAPGQEVEVPVFISSSVDLDAVQIVVDYDPAVFTPGDEIRYEGTFFGESPQGRGFSALKAWPEFGVFTIAIIEDLLRGPSTIPAGDDVLIAKIPGTISADVEPGSVLSLEARTEGFGEHGLRTELSHLGAARFVSAFPRVQGALLQIVGDLTFFRGDANGDEEVNVSDAQFVLNYLFVRGGSTLLCFDAADANDDGRVNIADAITLLSFLFDGGSTLPPPYPGRGFDPTQDSLSCSGVSS